jgi:hypothetical protein
MALSEVPGLLLPVAWHNLVRSWHQDCDQVISLQASGSCGPTVSVATGLAGSAPGPTNTLVSLAESKENANDNIREPACLYLSVCKTCCMYDVCIDQKYILIHIFSTYLYFVCIVCMCMYVSVCAYIFDKKVRKYTDRYRQYICIHTIQPIQPIPAINTDTDIYKQYTHIHAILMNTCSTCTYMNMYVCTCMCLYQDELLVLCMYMHLYVCNMYILISA